MELISRAEEVIFAMHSDDDFGRADVVTTLSQLRSVFPVSIGGDVTVSAPGRTLLARQAVAQRSAGLWRQRETAVTKAAAFLMSINPGTPPPGAEVRPTAASRELCWMDLSELPPKRALESIGDAIQMQYENLCKWQHRAKFKQLLDPRLDQVEKHLLSLRKSAKGDRLLVHVNGHGVPHPTPNGETWCFNADYTQYVPLSMVMLQQWAGAPATFVIDCSRAGLLVPFFAEQPAESAGDSVSAASLDVAMRAAGGILGTPASSMLREAPGARAHLGKKSLPFIVFAACGPNETLPVHPDMPADIFTACLTTPLKVALRAAVLRRSDVLPPAFKAFTDFLPGQKADRSSPMGELSWILTAVTDAIAWAVMPRPAFVSLFRSDFVASNLWRNFIVADRVMRTLGCVPVSSPALPRTYDHPLWAAWDSAVDGALAQLPALFGYNLSDVMRMSTLHLTPDVSGFCTAEWGHMVSAAREPEPGLASSTAPGPVPASSALPKQRAKSQTALPPTAAASSSGRSSLVRGESGAIRGGGPTSVALSPLIPFDMAFSVDALTLPIPPSASATAGERVGMLRRRLERAARTTAMGLAQTFAKPSLRSYASSSYFNEQFASFEAWLWDVTSRLPLRAGVRLADTVLDFIESADGSAEYAAQIRAATDMSATGLPLPTQQLYQQHFFPRANLGRTKRRFVSQVASALTSMTVTLPGGRAAVLDDVATAGSGPGGYSAELIANDEHSSSGIHVVVPVIRIRAPLQLPALRMALLSLHLRHRALLLFARFCDLGPEAVSLSLLVGVHDVICKLIGPTPVRPPPPPAEDVAPLLVFIWAKVLGVDSSLHGALFSAEAPAFFVGFLERMLDERAAARQSQRLVRRAAKGIDSLTAGLQDACSGRSDIVENNQTVSALYVLCALADSDAAGSKACWSPRSVRCAVLTLFESAQSLERRWALLFLRSLAHGSEDNRVRLLEDAGELAARSDAEARVATAAAMQFSAAAAPPADGSTPRAVPSLVPLNQPYSFCAPHRDATDPLLCWTPTAAVVCATMDGESTTRSVAAQALGSLFGCNDFRRTEGGREGSSLASSDPPVSHCTQPRQTCARLAAHSAEYFAMKLQSLAFGSHTAGLLNMSAQSANERDNYASLPASSSFPKVPGAVAAPLPQDILAVAAGEAFDPAFFVKSSVDAAGVTSAAPIAPAPNMYLRAAWALAHVIFTCSGSAPVAVAVARLKPRQRMQRIAERQRRRTLVYAVASRMRKLLLSKEALEEDAAAMKAALEQRSSRLNHPPMGLSATALERDAGNVAGHERVSPVAPSAFTLQRLGGTDSSQMASIAQQPTSFARSLTPLAIPVGSGFLIPTALSPRMATATPKAPGTPGRFFNAEQARKSAIMPGEYVTEAPPIDVLAEALSAGAAAANAALTPTAAGGRASSTGAKMRRVSSAASDLSGGGLSPMNRIESYESLAAKGMTQGAPASSKQRLVQSQSPGRPPPVALPAAATGKPRVRLPSGGRGSSMQPPPPSAAPRAVSVLASGVHAPASPPRLRGSSRPNSRSVDASLEECSHPTASAQGADVSQAVLPPVAVSPERAAADARRVARTGAGLRVKAMQSEFRVIQDTVHISVREACLAVCLSPMLQDGCLEARHEAVASFSVFAQRAVHESGLVVAAAASLVDFATGGTCIRRALRLMRGPTSHGSVETSAAPAPIPGHLTSDPTASTSAALGASGVARTAAARKQDTGNRARFNLLSRVFGSSKSTTSPAYDSGSVPLPSQAHVPPVSSPLSRPANAALHGPAAPLESCDLSVLGLPDGTLTLQSISAAVLVASRHFRMREAEAAPPDEAPAAADVHEGIVEGSWLTADAAGKRDPVMQVCVRELGASGILYASIWVALLAATTDPSEKVAAAARTVVQRITWRLIRLAAAPPESSETAVVTWRATKIPSVGSFRLESSLRDVCASRLMQPMLGPNPADSTLDSLSVQSLERSARRRALHDALMEATALAAAAYDDASLCTILCAAAGIGAAIQRTSHALLLRPVGSIDMGARSFLAAARGHRLLAAATAAAVAADMQQPMSAALISPTLGAKKDAVLSPPPAAMQTGRAASQVSNSEDSRVADSSFSGPFAHLQLWQQQQRQGFPSQNSSPAMASSLYGSSGDRMTQLGSMRGNPAPGVSTPWYGSSSGLGPQSSSLGTAGNVAFSRPIEMSPALLPAPAPSLVAPPPEFSLGAADPSSVGAQGLQQLRRGSRVASEYDSRNTSGSASRDARLSAALMAASDLSSLQLLSSSSAASDSEYSGSPLVAGTSRMRAPTTLLGTIAETSEAPLSASATVPPTGSLSVNVACADTALPSAAIDDSSSGAVTVPRNSTPSPHLSGVEEASTLIGENLPGVGPALPSHRSMQTAYSYALLEAAASAGALSGAVQVPATETITEPEVERSLRSLASITPRLAPSLLARTTASSVHQARSAARKLVQRCLIDTGAPMTSGVLFHPLSDLIVSADHSDTLALWSMDNGAPIARFVNRTSASCSGPLWSSSWQATISQDAPRSRACHSSSAVPPRELHPSSPPPLTLSRGASFYMSLPGSAPASHAGLHQTGRAGVPPLAPPAASEPPKLPVVHPTARVTSMSWLDEHDACHLLTVDEAGAARVYDGRALVAAFHARHGNEGGGSGGGSSGRPESALGGAFSGSSSSAPSDQGTIAPRLLSAFSALPPPLSLAALSGASVEADTAPGITAQWMPARAQLAVAGGRSPVIRLWDLEAEKCAGLVGVAAGSGAYVTSLTSAWPGTNLLVAGLTNGTVNVLDLRVGLSSGGSGGLCCAPSWGRSAVVASLREHKHWVVNVAQARSGSAYALCTGSVLSDVRFWDLRRPMSLRSIQAHRGAMTALAVHDFAPLIATGTQKQQVRVFTNAGEPVAEVRYHEGFLGQRIGPVSCLAFHPHRLFLGVGSLDSIIAVHSGFPQATGADAQAASGV